MSRPALVWEKPLGFKEQSYRTSNPRRTYTIKPAGAGQLCLCWEFQRSPDPEVVGTFDTLDAAKAAAERHWQGTPR